MVSSIFFTQSTDQNANLFQKQLWGTLKSNTWSALWHPLIQSSRKNNNHNRSKIAAITFWGSFSLDEVRGRNEGTGGSSLSSLQTSNSLSLQGLCWSIATLDLPPDAEVTAFHRFLHQLPLAISVFLDFTVSLSLHWTCTGKAGWWLWGWPRLDIEMWESLTCRW